MATTEHYNVIACDGGGIRGLMAALLLQRLEPYLGSVSLFAGTSTGGLLALGLAGGLPIGRLVEVYRDDGPEIFHPFDGDPAAAAARLRTLYPGVDADSLFGEFFHVKYGAAGLRRVVQGLFPGDRRLDELTTGVMVSTLQLYDPARRAWVPRVLHNLPGTETGAIPLVDAALATSAAPLYFPPHDVPGLRFCVDGGTFANNPSTLAIAQVVRSGVLHGHGDAYRGGLDRVRMISLGTGNNPVGIPPSSVDHPDDYGILRWLYPFARDHLPAFPLTVAVFDGTADAGTFESRGLLGEDSFRRANIPLPRPIALDDYAAVKEMERLVDAYVQTQPWRELVDFVRREFR